MEAATQTLAKNFKQVNPVQVKPAKRAILKILEKEQSRGLVTKIRGAQRGDLSVLFSAKTHKEGIPFRAIVSEQHTWQGQVSIWLAKYLSQVQVKDPFRIPNSEAVIRLLQENGSDIVSGFSLDIQDLCYSIPHAALLKILPETIEEQGLQEFQNSTGMSLDSFLELLSAYLSATVVSHQD